MSNATAGQVAEARAIAPIVCVQNLYNAANRGDDDLIDALAADGIAYVPFFPLGGGFTRVRSEARSEALSWLLRRSPNVLLIPGTSSVAHLRENILNAS